ncbi:MAG: hypothetical protein MZV64_59360 [Ignavibacteriales bacterium]|nr:hypothetical protein [Ignavibacteriales bacterium]
MLWLAGWEDADGTRHRHAAGELRSALSPERGYRELRQRGVVPPGYHPRRTHHL